MHAWPKKRSGKGVVAHPRVLGQNIYGQRYSSENGGTSETSYGEVGHGSMAVPNGHNAKFKFLIYSLWIMLPPFFRIKITSISTRNFQSCDHNSLTIIIYFSFGTLLSLVPVPPHPLLLVSSLHPTPIQGSRTSLFVPKVLIWPTARTYLLFFF